MAEKTQRFENLFVVIDPTRMIQPALIKADWFAARDEAALQLYCCVFDEHYVDNEVEQQLELDLTREWLERLAAPLRARGLTVDVRVEWNYDWREAVIAAANAVQADLVIKTASRHTPLGRRFLKTSDWMLLRDCTCPVLLVSGHRIWKNKRLLAAVKMKPEDDAHARMNDDLLSLARNLAVGTGFELNAVTAYQGEGMFFDRQELAKLCGLPRGAVFTEEGVPERAIARVAEEINADVIVIGNPGESTRHTARLLIDQVKADVLVLPNR